MVIFLQKQRPTLTYRILCACVSFTFALGVILPPTPVSAQIVPQTILNLPLPGAMVPTTPGFMPPLIQGLTVHPENPLEFDFIVNTGDEDFQGKAFEEESTKLIKYFLASLTVPEDEMWVNLSPYEKDRIIPRGFGETEMGRDLLAQDYILKQLTASLMYPEDELGKKFWNRVYQKAYERYGTTEIPMNTFNKVWIVPERAVVYEYGTSAFVIKSRLKVMLEEDYKALQANLETEKYGLDRVTENDADVISGVTSEIVREVLIPEIEKEVNEGKTFANLRQIYNSVILAAWFKQNLKDSLLGKVYVDKTKTRGIDVEDKQVNQKIYEQYLEAFKKGVYNYIREDYDPATQEIIPRKYFSGGTEMKVNELVEIYKKDDPLSRKYQEILGDYLAGQSGYNSKRKGVKINLVELSKNTPVKRAMKGIEKSKKNARIEKAAFEGIKEIVSEHFDVMSETVRLETNFAKDLFAGSAVMEKLFVDVEIEFEIPEITDKESEKIHTVSDLLKLVRKKKATASSPVSIEDRTGLRMAVMLEWEETIKQAVEAGNRVALNSYFHEILDGYYESPNAAPDYVEHLVKSLMDDKKSIGEAFDSYPNYEYDDIISSPLAADRKKPTILIVEDEETLRLLYEEIFSDEYDVIIATNGVKALEKLRENSGRIKVILTDWNMPETEIGGFELIKETNEKYPGIPVIISSALYEDLIDELKKKPLVHAGVLPKPAPNKDVLAAVRKAIDEKASSSPVMQLPTEVELINTKERTPHWIVNLDQISAKGQTKRWEVIGDGGVPATEFLPVVTYRISRGTDVFGSLTLLIEDDAIHIQEVNISEPYILKGIGFTVLNWVNTIALEKDIPNVKMRTRKSSIELELLQEMLKEIEVGGFNERFVKLEDPNATIIDDPVVKRIVEAGKEVEVRGIPNPPLPFLKPGAEMVRTLPDVSVKGKRVFMLVDHNGTFNEQGEITATQRINANTPGVAQLFDDDAELIIMGGHIERPGGKVVETLSPKPVADYLKGVFPGRTVIFIQRGEGESPEDYLRRVKETIQKERLTGLLYLDNMRFDPREKAGSEDAGELARQIREMADVYVDDAFSVTHRSETRVYELAYQFEPDQRAAGPSLYKELVKLYGYDNELTTLPVPKKSLAVIAGAKLAGKDGKLQLLKGFGRRVNTLKVGGLIAVTFLKSEAQKIGRYDPQVALGKAQKAIRDLEIKLKQAKGAEEAEKFEKELKGAQARFKMVEGEPNEIQEAADVMRFFAEHKEYAAPGLLEDFVGVPIAPTEKNPGQLPEIITAAEFLSTKGRRLENYNIIDIGPKALAATKHAASESALIIWNGSLGFTKIREGQRSTWEFAQHLATLRPKGIKVAIGGGNTIDDAVKAGLTLEDVYEWVFLGGGATQEFLIGIPLPGHQPLLKVPTIAHITSSPVTIPSAGVRKALNKAAELNTPEFDSRSLSLEEAMTVWVAKKGQNIPINILLVIGNHADRLERKTLEEILPIVLKVINDTSAFGTQAQARGSLEQSYKQIQNAIIKKKITGFQKEINDLYVKGYLIDVKIDGPDSPYADIAVTNERRRVHTRGIRIDRPVGSLEDARDLAVSVSAVIADVMERNEQKFKDKQPADQVSYLIVKIRGAAAVTSSPVSEAADIAAIRAGKGRILNYDEAVKAAGLVKEAVPFLQNPVKEKLEKWGVSLTEIGFSSQKENIILMVHSYKPDFFAAGVHYSASESGEGIVYLYPFPDGDIVKISEDASHPSDKLIPSSAASSPVTAEFLFDDYLYKLALKENRGRTQLLPLYFNRSDKNLLAFFTKMGFENNPSYINLIMKGREPTSELQASFGNEKLIHIIFRLPNDDASGILGEHAEAAREDFEMTHTLHLQGSVNFDPENQKVAIEIASSPVNADVEKGFKEMDALISEWKWRNKVLNIENMISETIREIQNLQRRYKFSRQMTRYQTSRDLNASLNIYKGQLWRLYERAISDYKDFNISEKGVIIPESIGSSPIVEVKKMFLRPLGGGNIESLTSSKNIEPFTSIENAIKSLNAQKAAAADLRYVVVFPYRTKLGVALLYGERWSNDNFVEITGILNQATDTLKHGADAEILTIRDFGKRHVKLVPEERLNHYMPIDPQYLKDMLKTHLKFGEIKPSARVFVEVKASSPVADASLEVSENVGGINLDPTLLDLQIKRNGNGIPLPVHLQPIEIMNIEGFLPVIINVTPITNLPMLLGLDIPDNEERPVNSADSQPQTRPFDLGFIEKYRNKYIRGYQYHDDDMNV